MLDSGCSDSGSSRRLDRLSIARLGKLIMLYDVIGPELIYETIGLRHGMYAASMSMDDADSIRVRCRSYLCDR